MQIVITGLRAWLACVYCVFIIGLQVSWADEEQTPVRIANFDPSKIQLDIGMFSYHLTGSRDRNEQHDLLGIAYNRWGIGTFVNSHHNRSNYVAYEYLMYDFNVSNTINTELGALFSIVSGYENSSLKTVYGFTVIPALQLNTVYRQRVGVTLFGNPVIVGVKFFLRPF